MPEDKTLSAIVALIRLHEAETSKLAKLNEHSGRHGPRYAGGVSALRRLLRALENNEHVVAESKP